LASLAVRFVNSLLWTLEGTDPHEFGYPK